MTIDIDRLRLVAEDEAARMLDVASQTMSVWRLRGCGPAFIKIGRNVRCSVADLQAWLDARRVTSTGQADAL